MSSKLLIAVAAGLAMLLSAGSASASTVLITITDDGTGPGLLPTIFFVVPESPDPSVYDSGMDFSLSVEVDGLPTQTDIFKFYEDGLMGGISDGSYDTGFSGITGPLLFTGDVNDPTFKTGTFAGTYLFSDPAVDATITIAELATTPLPSTWLMLLSGLVGLAYFTRRGTYGRSPIHVA